MSNGSTTLAAIPTPSNYKYLPNHPSLPTRIRCSILSRINGDGLGASQATTRAEALVCLLLRKEGGGVVVVRDSVVVERDKFIVTKSCR
jgi:hypothetical protein